jgi:hypothetical protein
MLLNTVPRVPRVGRSTNSNLLASIKPFFVNNAFTILSRETDSIEKAFGIVEKTGLLGQCIRCIPVDPTFPDSAIMQRLQTCSQLVKKNLKSGTPTGDILDAVIAGKGGPINAKAKSCLIKLLSIAWLDSPTTTTIVSVGISNVAKIATRWRRRWMA